MCEVSEIWTTFSKMISKSKRCYAERSEMSLPSFCFCICATSHRCGLVLNFHGLLVCFVFFVSLEIVVSNGIVTLLQDRRLLLNLFNRIWSVRSILSLEHMCKHKYVKTSRFCNRAESAESQSVLQVFFSTSTGAMLHEQSRPCLFALYICTFNSLIYVYEQN